MMLKDEIKVVELRLKNLKEEYSLLIEDIKKVFYEKEDYFNENSKRVPSKESDYMSAAYCVAIGYSPKYSFDLNIRQAQGFGEKKEYMDYFYVYDKRFETQHGTKPVCVFRLKNIKKLDFLCKKAWLDQVNSGYNDSVELGFKDWLKQTPENKILDILRKINSVYMDVVNDRKLKVKDIVIVYPKSIKKDIFY